MNVPINSSYRICAVILSAGASSRMGQEKALLPWPPAAENSSSKGATLLSAAIAALKPFVEAVIVVAGHNASSIAPVVTANGASMVENPAPERGQFSSLQVGLREVLALGYDAAMITLVDSPPLRESSMASLIAAFDRSLANGKWAVAPEQNGKHGHPLLASSALIHAFLAAPVTSNAREVKRAHAEWIESVSVPDRLLSVNVNTPEQYAALSISGSKLN
jgi:molybdenum cofactor cytidylyltransferase